MTSDGLDALRRMLPGAAQPKHRRRRRRASVARLGGPPDVGTVERMASDCSVVAWVMATGDDYTGTRLAMEERGVLSPTGEWRGADGLRLEWWLEAMGCTSVYDADVRRSRHLAGHPLVPSMTVRALARDNPVGVFYCYTARHAFALRDGVVQDAHTRPTARVLGVWEFPEVEVAP